MNKFITINNKEILRIGIGTSGFGGYFKSNKINNDYKKEFISFFCQAYEYGIRLIDTAENYASGESEKLLGCLPKQQRENFFIASKFNFVDSKLQIIENALDKTLIRLKRDYVDLYMPHWPFPDMNSEELIDSLNILKSKGKLLHIGLSNFENYFNKFKNFSEIEFYESELNPYYFNAHSIYSDYLNKLNSFFIGYAPFKQGLVFNKMSKVFNFYNQNYDKNKLKLSQFILIWMLLLSDRIISIPKTQNIDRLKEFIDVFDLEIDILNHIKKNISSIDFHKEEKICVNKIIMKPDGDRPIYYNLEDAIKNEFSLYPNVLDIANEIKKNQGNISKPVRLIYDETINKYYCMDGRLKYWAWVYIYGNDSKIPSVIY